MDTLLDIGLRNALGATALAILAAGLCCVCRRPALRHSLWLLVLLKLVAPPLLPVRLLPPTCLAEAPAPPAAAPSTLDPEPFPRADEEPAGAPEPLPAAGPSAPAAEPGRPAPPRLPGWRPVVLSLWLTGSALWWVLAGLRLARFRRLLRYARAAPAPVQEQAARLAARLGLARCPGVAFVPAPLSPMLWALAGRPRLLLPAALWDRLGAEQQDTLLAHELAHLRRRDHWVRRLELLVLGLYWWHPVAWWARRELREAEEQCCDAWVVWALPAAVRAYATALLETVTFLSQARPALPAAASGAGHVQLLKRRLTMILRGSPPRTLTWGGLLLVGGLAALLLPLWPTWAEPPRPAGTDSGRHSDIDRDAPPPDARAAAAADEEPANPPRRGQKRGKVAEEEEDQPKPKEPPARPGERGSQVEDLQDEIEILEVQLDVRKAELAAAQKALESATVRLDRIQKLNASGAITTGELTRAQGEVTTLEAQLLVKKAELKEPEVRLRQARRRLEQLQGRLAPVSPPSGRASWAENLFAERSRDFGPVIKGAKEMLRREFVLTNTTRDIVHISGWAVSDDCLKVSLPPTELKPGEHGSITVVLDSRRYTGAEVMKVFVDFDRPEAAQVFLTVRAHLLGEERKTPGEAKEEETRQRLDDLEKKLDKILKEMDALKKQLGPQKPGGMGAAEKDVRYYVSRSRSFRLPIQVQPAEALGLREIRLYSSTDEGKSWQQTASVPPWATGFDFSAPNDGVYWFAVRTVGRDGKEMPEVAAGMAPDVKVRVDTTDPP